jgi:hypothetical protein
LVICYHSNEEQGLATRIVFSEEKKFALPMNIMFVDGNTGKAKLAIIENEQPSSFVQ